MIARDLMTPDPLTVTPKTSLAEAWDLIREAEVRHLPVVEAGILVGMLSDRDLARVDMARLLKTHGANVLREALASPIVEVMTTQVVSVEPDTDVGDVIRLLIDHRIGAVPVTDAGTREVLGIISYVDVLRALQSVLEEEA